MSTPPQPLIKSLRQSAREIPHFLLTLADWRLVSVISVMFPALIWAYPWLQWRGSRTFFSTNFGAIRNSMAAYHDKWHALPPVVTYDEYGTAMHSWRTLILTVFDTSGYRLDEPWDSATNTKVAMWWDGFPRTQIGPDRLFHPAYIFAITDDKGEWKISPDYFEMRTTSSRDGTPLPSFEPMVFFEAADSDIPWTQPVDLTRSECLKLLGNQTIQKPIWAFQRLSTVMDARWFDCDIPHELPASVHVALLYGGEAELMNAWNTCEYHNAQVFGGQDGRRRRMHRHGRPELQEIAR